MNPSKTKIVFVLKHTERNQQLGGLTTHGKNHALQLGLMIFQQIDGRYSSGVIIVSDLDHGTETGIYILEALKGDLRRYAKIIVQPRLSFDTCKDGENLVQTIAAMGHECEVCIAVGHGSAPVGIARKYAQVMSLPLIEDKEPVFGSGYKIDIEKRTVERFHLDDDLVSTP